ncbi:MAG: four helix bundle suffix domain-containing protein [Desulfovermiculus sp.]|nr:four helix bundle suffix domain-containing protein [Desulfovermiculus sp.]
MPLCDRETLIPQHGGYRNLKSFQIAQLIYDVTVRFCDRYIHTRSRTHDQMVQAARSGVQNIAEGSKASATSKKMELKLTSVARASLEELRLDYEDFLRQRGMPMLPADHPALVRFKQRRCSSLEDVRQWVAEEHALQQSRKDTDKHRQIRTGREDHRESRAMLVGASPCASLSPGALAANGALSLLNLACHLLTRQIERQARDFEQQGGFTERLYRVRSANRRRKQ